MTWFNLRRKEIDAEASRNSGRIKRQDLWRKDYYINPYLARATEEAFFQRVCDIFHNMAEIDPQGRISIKPSEKNDNWMMQRWAHVMEEAAARGGFPSDMLAAANGPLDKYFKNGQPIGDRLFHGATTPTRPLVKYSRREFIERMFLHGEMRVTPASFYANGNLLDAQVDLETQRDFIIPTATLAAKGFRHANIDGGHYDISKGDVSISQCTPDYYVYCMCGDIDRRLPIDFEADAALVIHDHRNFQRRFFDALREKLKGWDLRNGEVTYYDPYTDYKRYRVLEMTKNLKFHYQKEFRLVARPRQKIHHSLEPFYINIGSLESISTPHYLK